MKIDHGTICWTIRQNDEAACYNVCGGSVRPWKVKAHEFRLGAWTLSHFDEATGVVDDDSNASVTIVVSASGDCLDVFASEEEACAAYLDSPDGPVGRFYRAVSELRDEVEEVARVAKRLAGEVPLAGRVPLLNQLNEMRRLLTESNAWAILDQEGVS